MSGALRFGVFEVFGPQVGGTVSWPHPLSDSIEFADPQHWVRLARLMDATGYDFLFFADGFGYPILGDDIAPAAVRSGINFSGYDPATLLPLLMAATDRLGFVVTATTGIDHPVQLARRFSTLDLVSNGRIGWNIVTGASQNAVAELFGHEALMPHDVRYALADEFVRLARAYWEDAWDDGALVADRATGVYADAARVHRTMFEGEHYRSRGYFGAPPTPQRTPVLFQAGTSPAGRAFAATHAECVFVQATSPAHTRRNTDDIRARAAAAGRPAPVVMVGLTAIVAETIERGEELAREFDALQDDDVVATLYAGNTGIDLRSLDPDRTLHQVLEAGGPVGQLGTSNIERFLGTPGSPAPTVREILDSLKGQGTRGFRLVGDAATVADGVERLADEAGVDGFLLEPVFGTRDVAAFGDAVLPILRERGRLPRREGATFRHRLLG
ncbi:NtaA/DmoA family FMN-dependent monooxygenase [Microbacterium sp. 10M-3C3]|jgi:FMN-dependent oxidoreductase (nitrilotriacetate monooxygenase family)|uniref:NtaA/DmoA family FMN-dependent monooxygenase n=1 Tax=Microbacterium sp. 10M-3C3 TaxID=2483401 RepID=UPI0013DE5A1C|nr:NtaA/DmoA family FMN-dependent monooxygenase [Microbacterium sp. 10M-3C3]